MKTEHISKYRKPTIVSKSSPRQAFVAGCGAKGPVAYCSMHNIRCMVGSLK